MVYALYLPECHPGSAGLLQVSECFEHTVSRYGLLAIGGHSTYTLRSTSTECSAHSATWAAGTPPLSQVDTAACRKS